MRSFFLKTAIVLILTGIVGLTLIVVGAWEDVPNIEFSKRSDEAPLRFTGPSIEQRISDLEAAEIDRRTNELMDR